MQTSRIVQLLGSLRLTVVCLACAATIVFWGTMAQVETGVYAAQQEFFRSWFVTAALPGTGVRLPVFPGGYLVGGITALNIVFALIQRRRTAKQSPGLWLTHAGLLLLLIGQFSTDMLAVESVMRLVQGQPQWYSEDQRRVELAIVETTQPD
ncbi:MAG: cytochrome c biogenesis protein ResB, partial [Verrucomicrobiia bacterium]